MQHPKGPDSQVENHCSKSPKLQCFSCVSRVYIPAVVQAYVYIHVEPNDQPQTRFSVSLLLLETASHWSCSQN